MIISTFQMIEQSEIDVSLYDGASKEPFVIRLSTANNVHLSLSDARLLQVQLTAALYEYDTSYKHKESE